MIMIWDNVISENTKKKPKIAFSARKKLKIPGAIIIKIICKRSPSEIVLELHQI